MEENGVGEKVGKIELDVIESEGELLEPIWSELELFSNGDSFLSSEIVAGEGKMGPENCNGLGAARNDDLGREKIGADFWKVRDDVRDPEPILEVCKTMACAGVRELEQGNAADTVWKVNDEQAARGGVSVDGFDVENQIMNLRGRTTGVPIAGREVGSVSSDYEEQETIHQGLVYEKNRVMENSVSDCANVVGMISNREEEEHGELTDQEIVDAEDLKAENRLMDLEESDTGVLVAERDARRGYSEHVEAETNHMELMQEESSILDIVENRVPEHGNVVQLIWNVKEEQHGELTDPGAMNSETFRVAPNLMEPEVTSSHVLVALGDLQHERGVEMGHDTCRMVGNVREQDSDNRNFQISEGVHLNLSKKEFMRAEELPVENNLIAPEVTSADVLVAEGEVSNNENKQGAAGAEVLSGEDPCARQEMTGLVVPVVVKVARNGDFNQQEGAERIWEVEKLMLVDPVENEDQGDLRDMVWKSARELDGLEPKQGFVCVEVPTVEHTDSDLMISDASVLIGGDKGTDPGRKEVELTRGLGSEMLDVHRPPLTTGLEDSSTCEIMQGGVLSIEGLASRGMIIIDDTESDEEPSEEEESESSEEDQDESEESDSESSSDDSSEEEQDVVVGNKPKLPRNFTDEVKASEDSEPPRTKHELATLPPVPKVEAVLEPHHNTISVGTITSVLDLTVVVEGSDDKHVLNEGSILWLTGKRIPLGIVDEVFGPVKNPYYLVRFNELSEIPEEAKVQADISYVREFSEFVLKDDPSLYKKAVDASGLDDEELSDGEIEFSDDEKEAEARQRERNKRGFDSRENGGDKVRDSLESQIPEAKGRWQRRERGRGRGSNRGAGPHMSDAVHSAAMSVADMDIQGSAWQPSSSGNRHQQRGRGKSKQSSATRAKFQTHPARPSSLDRDLHDSGTNYFRRQEGRPRGDRRSPSSHSQGLAPASGFGNSPQHQSSMRGRDDRRDGPRFSEQANGQMYSDTGDGRVHQTSAMQGFGGGSMPRHLQGPGAEPRQQPNAGYQSFGYSNPPGHAPQLATDGQGNFFHIQAAVPVPAPDGGSLGQSNSYAYGMNVGPTILNVLPHSSQNLPSVFVNNSSPHFNNQRQGSINLVQGAGNPIAYQAERNFRLQQSGQNLGSGQGGVHNGAFIGSVPVVSGRMVAPDYRFQAMPLSSQNSGPGPSGGAGFRGSGSGYHHDHGRGAQGHRNARWNNQASQGR